jgi:uncharacterized protein YcbX
MPLVAHLATYPIKGFSPLALQDVRLQEGQGFPFDRVFALTNGDWDFDPLTFKARPKADFLTLMKYPALASLSVEYDLETRRIRVQSHDYGC